jgi:hypothetical protein
MMKLSFRPFVDINPLPNTHGYEITHKDGVSITVFRNPIQIKFMNIHLGLRDGKGGVALNSEYRVVENLIVMPTELPQANFEFDYQQIEWLRSQKEIDAKIFMKVLISYALVGDDKKYVLEKMWRFDGHWNPDSIQAT